MRATPIEPARPNDALQSDEAELIELQHRKHWREPGSPAIVQHSSASSASLVQEAL